MNNGDCEPSYINCFFSRYICLTIATYKLERHNQITYGIMFKKVRE